MQEDAKSVIVELRHQRSRKEHLLHEEYNTEHEVSAIPDELRAAVWREGGQPEIQSRAVIHLLLAEAMGRKHGIAAMSIEAAPFAPEPAHGRRIEADPQHAAQEPRLGDDRAMVSPAGARIQPLCGEPVQSHETGRNDAAAKEDEEVQETQFLTFFSPSWHTLQ